MKIEHISSNLKPNRISFRWLIYSRSWKNDFKKFRWTVTLIIKKTLPFPYNQYPMFDIYPGSQVKAPSYNAVCARILSFSGMKILESDFLYQSIFSFVEEGSAQVRSLVCQIPCSLNKKWWMILQYIGLWSFPNLTSQIPTPSGWYFPICFSWKLLRLF